MDVRTIGLLCLLLGLATGCYRTVSPPSAVELCEGSDTKLVLILHYKVSGRGMGDPPLPVAYEYDQRDYIRIPAGGTRVLGEEIDYFPFHTLTQPARVRGHLELRDNSVTLEIELPDYLRSGEIGSWTGYELNGEYPTQACQPSTTLPRLGPRRETE